MHERSMRSLPRRGLPGGAKTGRLATAAVAAAAILAPTPAAANGGIAMAVDIKNSQQTMRGEEGGSCTWEVLSDVIIVNLTSQSLSLDAVGYSVSFTSPDDSGVQGNVRVLNNGGLVPGITLGPDERRTFAPVVVQFTIPCAAEFGDLAVRVTSPQGMGSGDAPFLSGGTPVPPSAIGALGLATVAGAWFVVRQRRRRQTLASTS